MSLSIRMLLLVIGGVAVTAPLAEAAPISYEIAFTLGNGAILPTNGSFVYDDTVPGFSSFSVVWNGNIFDFTQGLTPANQPLPGVGHCIAGGGPAAMFAALNNTCLGDPPFWRALSAGGIRIFDIGSETRTFATVLLFGQPDSPEIRAEGGLSILEDVSPSPVIPEPATGVLTLLGFGAAGLRRRLRMLS